MGKSFETFPQHSKKMQKQCVYFLVDRVWLMKYITVSSMQKSAG